MRRIMAAFLVTMAALAPPAQARTLVMGVAPKQSASAEAPTLTKGAGFDAASDADYAPVRALNIPPAPRRADDALTPC
jgi:hypothetical protein